MQPDLNRMREVHRVYKQAIAMPVHARLKLLESWQERDPDLYDMVMALLDSADQVERYSREALAPPRAGDRLGSYRLEQEIGQGGTGLVFLAVREDDTGLQVAIKILKRGMDTEHIVRRFTQERQILAALNHPSIAQLYDAGSTADGLPYFVMEYVDGEPIDQYCARLELSRDDRLKLFAKVSDAVSFAHQNLVIHRDLKPANILVTRDGDPKLLDFGISGLLDPTTGAPRTATDMNERMMTLEYASPEQLRGERLGTATDIFSLGVILYKLLTGRRPFRFPSREPFLAARLICETPPLRPSAVDPEEDGESKADPSFEPGKRSRLGRMLRKGSDIDNIALKALHSEPGERYASVEQFSEDIHRYFRGLPILARTRSVSYRIRKYLVRNRWVLAMTTAFFATVSSFALYTLHLQRQTARERDTAEQALLFLTELFEVNNPDRSKGESVTAKELLDRGAAEIRSEMGDRPQARARLLHSMGTAYHGLGLYPSAIQLYETALRDLRGATGSKNKEVAQLLEDLAYSYRLASMLDLVEPTLKEALKIRIALHGEADLRVSNTLHSLGSFNLEMSRFQEAESYYTRAYDIRHKILASDHPTLGDSLNALAIVDTIKGDYRAAEKKYRQVEHIDRQVGGPFSRNLGLVLANLGLLYFDQGLYDQALNLFQEAVAIDRKLLDQNHPYLGQSISNLGRLLRAMKRYPEAEPLLEEALELWTKHLEPGHYYFAMGKTRLGTLYMDTQRHDEAERLFREALVVALTHYGEDHVRTAYTQIRLAELLYLRGQYGEAEPLARSAMSIYRRSYIGDNYRTASAENVLGATLAGQGRHEEARPLLEHSHEVLKKVQPNGEDTAKAERRVARHLADDSTP
ncbi:Non-specific serine/threonine protein kinase [Sulfidibacter corallicola]|uniref:Serine/threonine protein kinase n=1 Tax=Sulfidibacter corallicola TaxID=2818388 RepID=A0A8A4TIY7_SULCO|nr:serine/threonine-protein kinase [Sulfidibacter corallicola]QTD49989.1 serine/threonine protein kinase [Sulfidibacter corallicola]